MLLMGEEVRLGGKYYQSQGKRVFTTVLQSYWVGYSHATLEPISSVPCSGCSSF